MTCDIKMLREKLVNEGQTHLWNHLETLSGEERQDFLNALFGIDFSFFQRAETSFQNRSYELAPIEIFTCDMVRKNKEVLQSVGLSAIKEGKIAAVLLCGL